MKPILLLSLILQVARVALAQQDLDCSFGGDAFLRSDGSVIFRHVTNPVQGTLKVELIYEGEGWLGLGFSDSNPRRMISNDAVIGLPNEPVSASNPAKYSLSAKRSSGVQQLLTTQQTLQDASITQNLTHTVLTFTKFLVEENEVELGATGTHNFIWAVGNGNTLPSSHRLRGDFTIELQPCRGTMVDDAGAVVDAGVDAGVQDTTPIFILSGSDGPPNRDLWIAHGVLMSVAWGILIPLAVGSSRLRDLFAPGMWFKIHQSLNMTAIICTIVGFAIAVYAINDQTYDGEEPNHFSGTAHKTVGLVIFLLTVLQAVGGLLRPHGPAKPASTAKESEADNLKNTAHSRLSKDEENHVSSDEQNETSKSTKTTLRFVWECKHRFMGVALLAMAWYNCSSGIEFFALRFGEEDDKRGAFWGVAAGIVGMIIALDVFQRVRL